MLVALAAGIAAAALDRVARVLGRPTRFAWLAALFFALGWPALELVRALEPEPRPGASGELPSLVATAGRALGRAASERFATWAEAATTAVVVLWAAVSVLLLARLALGALLLARRRARWRACIIDGVPVLVAPNVGPAVVGVRDPAIVLPEWALMLDPSLRALVLRHECEHVARHDAALRWLGAIATALVPWNPVTWWQADRLALAIEVDCDARVLRADARRDRYGLLLLTIAQRQCRTMLAPALSEPTSHLERRIAVMHAPRPRHRLLVTTPLVVLAAVALAVACSAPSPESVAQPDAPLQEYQVTTPVMPKAGNPSPSYPEDMKAAGRTGEVQVRYVVGRDGAVERGSIEVLSSTDEAFTASVLAVLPDMKYEAATDSAGRPVRQLVQQPFNFALAR